MSESTALAKALAAQLGDDLDRILGSEDSSDAPSFEMAEKPPTGLELRQVAGLSAGFTQSLPPGDHAFGAGSDNPAGDERTKPFVLSVDSDHRAWLITDVNVRLDGQVVRERTAVGRQVIDAGSARFVVSQAKPPSRRRGGAGRRAASAPTAPPKLERIRVSEYLQDEPVAKRRRFGLRSSDRHVEPSESPLIERMLEQREMAVQFERGRFPDPGQLKQMAMAGEDHMGHLESGDAGFAVVPVAYGDLTWQPPLDRPDRVPAQLVAAVQQHSILPSVPLSVDLRRGHLGIVGPRPACLALARQIAITLRVLSPRDAISLSLLSSAGAADDWEWIDRIPSGSGAGLPVTFFDGMRQISAHGMRQALIEDGTGGGIIIDDQLHDIPSLAGTVLEIQPSGTAAMLDFRRGATTTRVATPLGFDLETTNEFINWL